MHRSLMTLAALATAVVLLAFSYLSVRVSSLEQQLATMQPVRSASAAVAAPLPVIPRADLADMEKSTIALFSARSTAVVNITTIAVRSDPFRLKALEVPRGTGSGFIWDEAGHVITNFHVIDRADGARVTLSDHSVWNAKLVGISPRNDIAVLRIEPKGAPLSHVVLGSSHDLAVGQQVFAIGSPFGLDYTLSTGVISGLGREIEGITGLPIRGAIQTDAAINPGNSGGPLLDSSGRLIGMNTSILSPSGASAGIGFAVPVDTINRVVPQLLKFGRELRPMIGAEFADDAVTRRLGLHGVLLLRVTPGGPSERAGLQPTQQDQRSGRITLGDLIVGADGAPVRNSADLYLALETHKQGDKVKLTLERGGTQLQVEVEIELDVPPGESAAKGPLP
jgi:S1-C subfamily serine protease